MLDSLKAMTYTADESLFSLIRQRSVEVVYQLEESYLHSNRSFLKEDEVRFYFAMENIVTHQVQYPDSLLQGLAKIGGLMAIFKVSMFLQCMHKAQFEKGSNKQTTN